MDALFAEPHIHYKTKNISALKTASILRDMGIKNYAFILTLYDTDLADVDPFDPNLTPEIQRKIHAEVVRNYWYFLREIVRINVPGGLSSFIFHRGSAAVSWLLSNNFNIYIEQPRQTMKTGTIACFYAYAWGFKTTNTKIGMMCKDPETTKKNLTEVKSILENLPPYLAVYNDRLDQTNTERIFSPTTNNLLQTRNAPATDAQAINRGRGSTEPCQWVDEYPFVRKINIVTLNSASGWYSGAVRAKANGVPYGRCFSSTPGILGTEEGNFTHDDFLPQCMGFDEKLFYDEPNIEKTRNIVHENSRNDFVYVRFTYKQLGFGEDYFATVCRVCNNDQDTIDREVLLKWSLRSMDSPFTKEQLDRVFKHLKEPIGTVTIRQAFILKFFKNPDVNKIYVIAVDCSGMLNNDYSSLVVVDPQTFEPVATMKSNARSSFSNTRSWSRAIGDVATMLFPNAIIAIEANNMGIAVIDNITDEYPEVIPRLYSSTYEPSGHGTGFPGMGGNTDIYYDKKIVVYGFQTIPARRFQMMEEILGVVVTELYDSVNDIDIFTELNGVVRRKGRIDHKNGKHDDMLFAWLIALWVLCYSKILQERYGVPFGYIRPMSLLDIDDPNSMPNGKRNNSEQNIEELARKLTRSVQESTLTGTLAGQIELEKERYGIRGKSNDIVNLRTTRDPVHEYAARSPDLSDVADIIFGDGNSGINDPAFEKFGTIEFDQEIAEDVSHNIEKMNVDERRKFEKERDLLLNKDVDAAKQAKLDNLKKARAVKRHKQLEREFMDTNLTQTQKESLVDKFIDSFI